MITFVCTGCEGRVCVTSCENRGNEFPRFCPMSGKNCAEWKVVKKNEKQGDGHAE